MEKVLEILNEAGATVNKSKCIFFANEIEYIGFLINKNGICVNPRKIDPVINMPQPTNVKQLQSFFGAVNNDAKIDYLDSSINIKPRIHLNNSKLHLNTKGSGKLLQNFVTFIKKKVFSLK